MKVIAIIPARLQATRFPNKLLKDLCGKPVIVRTYEAVRDTALFSEVLIATDSEEIAASIRQAGGKVFMNKIEHDCGSNRIAEAAEQMDADVIINVQGDEPFTDRDDLKKLIQVFKTDHDRKISLASLRHPLESLVDIQNENNVKVITDLENNAIYFSRSPIPYVRDASAPHKVFKHIGIYAFRKEALLEFYRTAATPLELVEKIECLRYLEHGHRIRMVETEHHTIGIDTPSDLEMARRRYEDVKKSK